MKKAGQMKDCTLSGKDQLLLVALLQEFTSACDACGIPGGTTMCLFKQLLTGSTETAVKARLTLTTSAKSYHKSALKTSSAIVLFLLKHYVNDNIIDKPDAEVHNLRQASMALPGYAQEL